MAGNAHARRHQHNQACNNCKQQDQQAADKRAKETSDAISRHLKAFYDNQNR